MIEMLGYQIWLYGWFGYMGREHQFTGASVLASQKMWGGARVPNKDSLGLTHVAGQATGPGVGGAFSDLGFQGRDAWPDFTPDPCPQAPPAQAGKQSSYLPQRTVTVKNKNQ